MAGPSGRYRARVRVWIDSDVGDNPDDAVALLIARRHPDLELVGVSTSGTDPERRAAVARDLLGEGVPVLAGRLDERVREAEVLVVLGPLTNVAAFDPAIPVTLMGGALRGVEHRGVVRTVESNFAADPDAAGRVLRTQFCRVVPLDVTRNMLLDEHEKASLRGVHAELDRELAAWPHRLVLHDPLALLVALDEVSFEDEVIRVAVDRRGRVVEGRGIEQRVVVAADLEGAIEHVLEVLA